MIHEITNYVYHLGNTSGLLARNLGTTLGATWKLLEHYSGNRHWALYGVHFGITSGLLSDFLRIT